MILPQTYGLALLCLVFSLLCWGSWANTFKIASHYRFEFYYVDFALGFLAIAVVYAFTVGNMGFEGFQLLDDLGHSGKRQWLFGFLAGVIFNLGNMLLMSSVSVAGMSVAFPAAIGTGIIVASILSWLLKEGVNVTILLGGCALLAAAVIMAALVYNFLGAIRHEQLARAGKAKSTRRPTSVKGTILAVAGGVLLGCFPALMQKGMETEIGLGPYSIALMGALGVVVSAPLFAIFFMNLPVEGEPLEPTQFFRTSARHHILGALGGIVCATGAVAALVALSAPAGARVSPALSSLLLQASPLLAALWGIVAWKELREGDTRVKMSALAMLIFFAGGMTLIALAPVLPKE